MNRIAGASAYERCADEISRRVRQADQAWQIGSGGVARGTIRWVNLSCSIHTGRTRRPWWINGRYYCEGRQIVTFILAGDDFQDKGLTTILSIGTFDVRYQELTDIADFLAVPRDNADLLWEYRTKPVRRNEPFGLHIHRKGLQERRRYPDRDVFEPITPEYFGKILDDVLTSLFDPGHSWDRLVPRRS